MITAENISVVIITRNRPSCLKELLESMRAMELYPGEVVVVTSSDDIHAEERLAKRFRSLNVNVIFESQLGYSAARNRGIREASGGIVAFVDDDCVVPPGWIQSMVNAHKKIGKDAVIMGAVKSLPVDNFWVAVAQMHYDNWVNTICKEGVCSTLDAKVTSFDKRLFTKKHFWFDQKFAEGSEDIEFGYRLHKAGVVIHFDPSVYFFHFERTTWQSVLKQRWRIAKAEAIVAKSVEHDLVDVLPPTKLRKLIPRALKKLASWVQNKNMLWSIQYISVLPVFFSVRTLGYMWGNYQASKHI